MYSQQIYYDSENNLTLPHHPRAYYDYLASQHQRLPMDKKLADLGYLVTHGFNLKEDIRLYKKEREKYITRTVKTTIIYLIQYMRYGQAIHSFNNFMSNELSETVLINTLIKELKVRYDKETHNVTITYWGEDVVAEIIKRSKTKEKCIELIKNVAFSKEKRIKVKQ